MMEGTGGTGSGLASLLGWLDTLRQDSRYGGRILRRAPGFTVAVVLILGLGVGLSTAMFGIVHGMLIRPLPYPDASAIVRVGESSDVVLTGATLAALEAEAESFEQLAAYRERLFDWGTVDGDMAVRGAWVSPSLFTLLRVRPILGRLFTAADARAGSERVVLLSHGAWTRRFGSNQDVVGAVVELDGAPHTVVGVLDEEFYFPRPDAEVWTPWVMSAGAAQASGQQPPLMMAFSALGRLRPGVSPGRAATEIETILQSVDDDLVRRLRRGPSLGGRGDGSAIEARVISLQEDMVGEYRPALLALAVAVALVLLIACSNTAALLLSRGVTRQRELAIRVALGAGRGRVMRQLVTESVVMGLGGGATGLAAAAAVLYAVPALVPGYVPRLDEVAIDGVVFSFCVGLSVLVGLVTGTATAFQRSARNDLAGVAPKAESGPGWLGSNQARAALVVAQVALAIMLLVAAGLLLRSFLELVSIDRGYDPADVITARIRGDQGAPGRFFDALLERAEGLAGLPNVDAVGLSSGLPLASGLMGVAVRTSGLSVRGPGDLPVSRVHVVSSGYFDVMRLRLVNGRLFGTVDGPGQPRVMVVNETFAREVLGASGAVGQRVGIGEDWVEVVGVVADIRYAGLAPRETELEAFLSMRQVAPPLALFEFRPFISVRAPGNSSAVIPYLREAVAAARPRASLDDVMTMSGRLSALVTRPRLYVVFAGFFAVLALLLTAFGLYSLLSYSVNQRRREIGVRMALGAQSGDIIKLVVEHGTLLVVAGVAAGLLVAASGTRVLESFLFGVTPYDRITFVGAPVVLISVGLVACWLPGRLAARMNPIDVLRAD